MGLLPVLVYYASVAKAGRVLTEYKNRASRDLAPVVVECLEQVPPLHSRFTMTIKRRIFTCLMEGAFTYCCIVDEALGKSDAFGFLEAVRDEFMTFLDTRGLRRDGEGLETVQPMIHKEFGATIRVLTLPLIGVPQQEIDSLRAQASPSGSTPPPNGTLHGDNIPSPKMTEPLYSGSERSDGVPDLSRSASRAVRSGKSKKINGQVQQHLLANGGDEEQGRIDIVVVDNNSNTTNNSVNNNTSNFHNNSMSLETGDLYPHRKSFSVREAENRWWRNVKIVLILDIVVCIVLFVIWLGICKGFQCVS